MLDAIGWEEEGVSYFKVVRPLSPPPCGCDGGTGADGSWATSPCLCTDHPVQDADMDLVYAHGQVEGALSDGAQGVGANPTWGIVPG